MMHIPYGYKIENGKAVVDEAKAAQVRMLFELYISGKGLAEAGQQAGFERKYHSSIGRILRKEAYLGDGFYPEIISKELFEKAEEERTRRATKLGRVFIYEEHEVKPITHMYRIGKVDIRFNDPFEQAAYVYGLIESEE